MIEYLRMCLMTKYALCLDRCPVIVLLNASFEVLMFDASTQTLVTVCRQVCVGVRQMRVMVGTKQGFGSSP